MPPTQPPLAKHPRSETKGTNTKNNNDNQLRSSPIRKIMLVRARSHHAGPSALRAPPPNSTGKRFMNIQTFYVVFGGGRERARFAMKLILYKSIYSLSFTLQTCKLNGIDNHMSYLLS